MFEVFTIGPLRVTLEAESGSLVAVRDALTGCAASLLYSKGMITHAVAEAQRAWASLAELA